METVIQFAPGWMDASTLEEVLRAGPSPHEAPSADVVFRFPAKCNVMTDAAVRLLSLFNQLDCATRRVIVEFEEGEEGVLGYLSRIAFFECLSPNIAVLPHRPQSSAARYRGRNPGLVEIERIDRTSRDQNLVSRLTAAITRACSQRKDVKILEGAAWTILAELIDNVFSHSRTPLDGFAALQVYHRGNCLKVAVSDSGLGLLETLRPALRSESLRLAALSNTELLVEVFRRGLSRHGPSRGCGLKGCADKAIKFRAQLDLRLPHERVFLVPGKDGYTPNTAFCFSRLPLVWGTHVCFTLGLDERP
ncbi:MAG TPA: hypothetical protein VN577_12480 [Terriglobales bacterium]|nr:hypothetical protein [Terriglobales bacterium]